MSDGQKLDIIGQVAEGKLTREQAIALMNGPQESIYNGKPTLTLNPNDRFAFSFQIAKAKLIVDNFDAIKNFYEKNKDK